MLKIRPAMTLVETVLASAIFSVVTIMIYSVFIASTKAFERSNAQVELQMSYQNCADRISGIIKGASLYSYSGDPSLADDPSIEDVFTVMTGAAAELYEIYFSSAEGVIYIDRILADGTEQEKFYSCENVEGFRLEPSADDGNVFDLFIEGSLKGARRDITTSVGMRAG